MGSDPTTGSPSRPQGLSFAQALRRAGAGPLVHGRVTTLQVNVGRVCNMACLHCHVEAGPSRTERMSESVAARVVTLLETNPGVEVLDLTGGAPELNPSFRRLVSEARRLGRHVIDRCNLTVLFEAGQEDLVSFLAAHQVEVLASLPWYQSESVERQRGKGAFDASLEGLRRLNAAGYGQEGRGLTLNLVYNPLDPSLPAAQQCLEEDYKRQLGERFGIVFDRLLTITNMPIRRFARMLEREGRADEYQALLVEHFNPATVPALMCRTQVSVGHDGSLYDCDFNQMLDLGLGARRPRTVWEVDSFDDLDGAAIATGPHCFGCTAGAGSSCGGALR